MAAAVGLDDRVSDEAVRETGGVDASRPLAAAHRYARSMDRVAILVGQRLIDDVVVDLSAESVRGFRRRENKNASADSRGRSENSSKWVDNTAFLGFRFVEPSQSNDEESPLAARALPTVFVDSMSLGNEIGCGTKIPAPSGAVDLIA